MALNTNKREGDKLHAEEWNELVQEVQGKQSRLNIVDALDSTSSVDVLSAKQGKVLDEKITSANTAISGISDKVDKLPTGVYYGQYNSEEDLVDVQVTTKGYAYISSTDPAVYYIYLYNNEDGTWTNSGNKFVTTELETNLSSKSQTKAPTTKIVAEGLEAINVTLARSAEDENELTATQKYNALANINNRAVVIDQQTSEVKAFGYKVLNPNTSFASQVVASNTIYEIRDEFNLNSESITIPSNCTLKFNGGRVVNGSITDTGGLKVENMPKNNGVFVNGYNFQPVDGWLIASQIGMMEGEENKVHNSVILNRVISSKLNLELDGEYWFTRYNDETESYNIDYEFEIKNGTVHFVSPGGAVIFTPLSNSGLSFVNVNIYNSPNQQLIKATLDYQIKTLIFNNCKFNNTAKIVNITTSDLDYSQSPFGIRKFNLIGCEFIQALSPFVLVDTVTSDEFIVKDNVINNFTGTFINIGQTNAYTHSKGNKEYWCDVVCDNNTFNGGNIYVGHNTYYTPLLSEVKRVIYTNNTIKNMVAVDGYPAYDGYLSAEYVVFRNNRVMDVMTFYSEWDTTKTMSQIAKAKGSDFLSITNNYWDIDANRIREWCAKEGVMFTDDIRIANIGAPTFEIGVYYKKNTDNTYTQLTEEPTDWLANYANYYTKTDGKYSSVTPIDTAPSFESNKYYEYDGENYPTLLTEEPDDWGTDYLDYYVEVQAEGTFIEGQWNKTSKYDRFAPAYGWKLLIFEGNEVHIKKCQFGVLGTMVNGKNIEIHINNNIFDITKSNEAIPLIGIYGIYSENQNEKKIFEFIGNTINMEEPTVFNLCTPLRFSISPIPNSVNCTATITNNISNCTLIPAGLVKESIFKNNIITPTELPNNYYMRSSDKEDIHFCYSNEGSKVLIVYPIRCVIDFNKIASVAKQILFNYSNRSLQIVSEELGLDFKCYIKSTTTNIIIYDEYGKVLVDSLKTNSWEYDIVYHGTSNRIALSKTAGSTTEFAVKINAINWSDIKNVKIISSSFSGGEFLNYTKSAIKYQQSNGVYGIYAGDKYVDFSGRTAAKTRGTSSERPTSSLVSGDAGFMYFDTDLGKPIFWNGTAWIDGNGDYIFDNSGTLQNRLALTSPIKGQQFKLTNEGETDVYLIYGDYGWLNATDRSPWFDDSGTLNAMYDKYNYTLLTAEPSNWATAYNTYYKIVDGAYTKLNTFEEWAVDTFYQLDVNTYKGIQVKLTDDDTELHDKVVKWNGTKYINIVDNAALKAGTPIVTFTTENNTTAAITSTSSGKIYYTKNGDAPTSSSTEYSNAITLADGDQVKAICIRDHMDNSAIGFVKVATPVVSFNSAGILAITCDTADAKIYYTTDGSVPSTASTEYDSSASVTIAKGVTVNAIAVLIGRVNSEKGFKKRS